MKVALIYGYAEGPRIAKSFIEYLEAHGHQLVEDSKAEVIIAHSGGAYLIPDNNLATKVVLVGVPYYDNHWSFIKKLSKRVAEEGVSLAALQKFALNNWYVYSQPKRSYRMYRRVIDGSFHGVDGKRVMLVRNNKDLFGAISQDEQQAHKSGWLVQGLPGTHDDLWTNPEPYIKLLEKQL